MAATGITISITINIELSGSPPDIGCRFEEANHNRPDCFQWLELLHQERSG